MFKWIEGNVNKLIATINENNITLNQNAAQLFSDVRYVSVGLNEQKQLVAIHPVSKHEIEQRVFTPNQLHKISIGNGYGKISNKSLITMIIDMIQKPLNKSKFNCQYDQENDYLIIDLNQEVRKETL